MFKNLIPMYALFFVEGNEFGNELGVQPDENSDTMPDQLDDSDLTQDWTPESVAQDPKEFLGNEPVDGKKPEAAKPDAAAPVATPGQAPPLDKAAEYDRVNTLFDKPTPLFEQNVANWLAARGYQVQPVNGQQGQPSGQRPTPPVEDKLEFNFPVDTFKGVAGTLEEAQSMSDFFKGGMTAALPVIQKASQREAFNTVKDFDAHLAKQLNPRLTVVDELSTLLPEIKAILDERKANTLKQTTTKIGQKNTISHPGGASTIKAPVAPRSPREAIMQVIAEHGERI